MINTVHSTDVVCSVYKSRVSYAYPPSGCSLMTPQTDALNCTYISLKSQKKGYRDTKVKTRPIFLSSTLKRAIRFSSGPSDSLFVVTVNCHRSTHVTRKYDGPTSLTCCDSFAYSHKTFASSWVKLECDSYGLASNMPTTAADMIVKPTKEIRDSLRSCETRTGSKSSSSGLSWYLFCAKWVRWLGVPFWMV